MSEKGDSAPRKCLRRLTVLNVEGIEVRIRAVPMSPRVVGLLEKLTPGALGELLMIALEVDHGRDGAEELLEMGLVPLNPATEEEKGRLKEVLEAMGVPADLMGGE
jgi:hypothetical protein